MLTSTDVGCNGLSNGSATVVTNGGTAPFTFYAWSPSGGSGASANNLAADTYTVTVTDVNGCAANVIVVINEPDAVNISMSMTPAACNGGTNGTATATVNGGTPPYQYQWSPGGSTNATANNLGVGHYSVVVTDSRGCAEVNDIDVLSASGIVLTPSATDVSCYGGSNGTTAVSSVGVYTSDPILTTGHLPAEQVPMQAVLPEKLYRYCYRRQRMYHYHPQL